MEQLAKTMKGSCNDCFTIITGEGDFKIYSDNNGNLYWACSLPEDDSFKDTFKFTITHEDKYVYKLFEKLYNEIMDMGLCECKNHSNIDIISNEFQNLPIKNNGIEWHSDSFRYDAASVLRIDRDETDNYIVTFKKSKIVYDDISAFSTYAVEINSSVSRYDPYNLVFMKMYNDLKGYDMFPNSVLYAVGVHGKRRVKKR